MSARSPAGGRKRERIIAAPHVFADFQRSRSLEYAHEDSFQRAPPGNLRVALAGARVGRCRRACRRRPEPGQGRSRAQGRSLADRQGARGDGARRRAARLARARNRRIRADRGRRAQRARKAQARARRAYRQARRACRTASRRRVGARRAPRSSRRTDPRRLHDRTTGANQTTAQPARSRPDRAGTHLLPVFRPCTCRPDLRHQLAPRRDRHARCGAGRGRGAAHRHSRNSRKANCHGCSRRANAVAVRWCRSKPNRRTARANSRASRSSRTASRNWCANCGARSSASTSSPPTARTRSRNCGASCPGRWPES